MDTPMQEQDPPQLVPRPLLQGRKALLRPPRPSDREDRLRCGRRPELVVLYGGDPTRVDPPTAADAEEFYRKLLVDPLSWVIEVDGRAIGTARLHHLDQADRRARYAIGIFDPNMLGQGIGTEATRLVLRYAFEELGLHRVDLRVLAFNQRAIACYNKCGFVVEGVERHSALITGTWHDDVMMAILEDEYRVAADKW